MKNTIGFKAFAILFVVGGVAACEGDNALGALDVLDPPTTNLRTASPYQPYASETYLPGPKDVCIVTQFTSNMDVFAHIASDNHQAYAWRYGYNAFAYRGRISGDEFTDPGHAERLRQGGLYWQKLTAVERTLARSNADASAPLCKWVMWLDADAIFTNVYRSIEDVLAPYADKDVVLAREYEETLINAGVFFVKNTENGRAFVRGIASMYSDYKNRHLPEQEAMQDYAFATQVGVARPGLYDAVKTTLRPEIGIAAQRTFNSFATGWTNTDERSAWQPCDFIAHIAGTPAAVRAQMMQDMNAELAACAP